MYVCVCNMYLVYILCVHSHTYFYALVNNFKHVFFHDIETWL